MKLISMYFGYEQFRWADCPPDSHFREHRGEALIGATIISAEPSAGGRAWTMIIALPDDRLGSIENALKAAYEMGRAQGAKDQGERLLAGLGQLVKPEEPGIGGAT